LINTVGMMNQISIRKPKYFFFFMRNPGLTYEYGCFNLFSINRF
jgi:hypothetical protein